MFASFLPSSLDPKVCLEVLQPECFLDRQMTYPYKFHTYPRHIPDIELNMEEIIGVAKRAVFEFQKSSHMQPLEWPRVAAFPQNTVFGFQRNSHSLETPAVLPIQSQLEKIQRSNKTVFFKIFNSCLFGGNGREWLLLLSRPIFVEGEVD